MVGCWPGLKVLRPLLGRIILKRIVQNFSCQTKYENTLVLHRLLPHVWTNYPNSISYLFWRLIFCIILEVQSSLAQALGTSIQVKCGGRLIVLGYWPGLKVLKPFLGRIIFKRITKISAAKLNMKIPQSCTGYYLMFGPSSQQYFIFILAIDIL